jgi:hypothetical protein
MNNISLWKLLFMDIFSLHPNLPEYFSITEEMYFEKTQRRQPWATQTKKKTPLYLATCPECKNAIEIRELDRVRGENERAPMEPFGKHYQHDVPGLEIIYSQEAFDNCSLRSKFSLSASEPRANQDFNDEILKRLVEHAGVIREVIMSSTGIKLGPKLFEMMVKKFIEESRYKCKGVIPSNLPFGLLYWSESQGLIGQYLSTKAADIENAIAGSEHFCIDGRQIISKHWREKLLAAAKENKPKPNYPVWGPHKIAFFMGRRVHRGNEESNESNQMTLTITEHTNNKPKGTAIYSKKISYSNNYFPNAIVAFERRLQSPEKMGEAWNKKIEAGKIAYKYAAPLLPKDWLPSWWTKAIR